LVEDRVVHDNRKAIDERLLGDLGGAFVDLGVSHAWRDAEYGGGKKHQY